MSLTKVAYSSLVVLLMIGLSDRCVAQTSVPFTSGPIPSCNTSTFTANVSGIGMLNPPGTLWSSWFQALTINITSDHPQTLQVTLTSPAGTDLLLTEFNGAGGQNYTLTTFMYDWNPSITTGTAPFTGQWNAQGGSFSAFDGEFADGTWTITVTDTACANGGTGPGGNWTPGWFDGNANGAFAFGFTGPPPCWGGIPGGQSYICPGETVDILGYYAMNAPGYNCYVSFNWNPVADPSAVTQIGSYQIEAVDPWDGCVYAATYDVIASPGVALGADQIVDACTSDGPVDLTALFPLGGATPEWSIDGISITPADAAQAIGSGTYQLVGISGCGNDTALATLNFETGPDLGPDQSLSTCAGVGVDLTTLYDTGGLPADWSFGGMPVATPTAVVDAGVYTLTVTSATGCADQADVSVDVQSSVALGADQSVAICNGAAADLTTLYATTGLTTEWTLAGAFVADPSMVSVAGSYRLVASNGPTCADTAFVDASISSGPSLGADASAAVCAGTTVDLTSYYTTTGLSTSWTTGIGLVTDPTSVASNGIYILVATDAAGCSDIAQVNVVVSPNPVLDPDQSITECEGTIVDLTTLYATGANATAWTQNGGTVDDPANVTSSGAYSLVVTNAAGCTATATATLTFNPSPALGADQVASICSGSTFDLMDTYATAGLTGTWTLDGAAVADPASVDATGNYRLVVSNGSNCTDTAFVALTVNANPDLGADLSYTLCSWRTVDLGAVFPVGVMDAVYTLNGAAVGDPTAVHDAGEYTVSVTDANGCTDEALATIANIECVCEADFVYEGNCIQEPVSFTLLADSVILGAEWDFSSASPISMAINPVVDFITDEPVLVTLQATLTCGVVTVEQTIRVPSCADSCSVWIPSAFTPDGDTRNDAWTWQGECMPQDFSMQIYDRWGEMIFASNDPKIAWDGTTDGVVSPSGVYAYRVAYRLLYQKRKEVQGSITLLR